MAGMTTLPAKSIVACILLFSACQNIYPQAAEKSPNALTQVQIQGLVQKSREKIQAMLKREIYLPGMAVALVSADGVLWTEGFGYRDKTRREKVDTNTLFGLLSASKTLTVTALMVAVQEGLIDLDVPIRTYLPDFHIQTRFADDPMAKITIRNLLSMTSGLTHDAPVGNNADPYTPSYEDHILSIGRTWLRFRTGERAEYSNLGIELAAYILEKVTHTSFPEYAQKKIFGPLAMTRTTYDLERVRGEENRATGNHKIVERVPFENPYVASGCVYASIADMARFIQFQLQGGTVQGRTIIKKPILEQMRKIPFPVKDQVAGYCMGLWVGYYHLGGHDVRWFAHGGGGFGFQCQMKWLPELGYGAMVMSNSQDQYNGNEKLVEDLLQDIVTLTTGKKDLGASDWLSRYVQSRSVDSAYLPTGLDGRYNGTNEDFWFLVKDGQFGYASGPLFVPLSPVSPDEFASDHYLFRFVRDAEGRAMSVVGPYDGMAWVMGSRKDEAAGPGKQEWKKYTGTYIRKRYGVCQKFYIVAIENGWLHFEGSEQDFLLTEHIPGLFFTPDGEAVDFRSSTPTFRNIKLYRAAE